MHVTPRHAFQKTVLSQNADVLREIGVINAAGLQVEHLGREQRRQSNRAGRADDDLGEFFPLDVIQHLQDRRETQFLQLVFRQLEFADRLEIFNRDIVDLQVRCAKRRRRVPFLRPRRPRSFCEWSSRRRSRLPAYR